MDQAERGDSVGVGAVLLHHQPVVHPQLHPRHFVLVAGGGKDQHRSAQAHLGAGSWLLEGDVGAGEHEFGHIQRLWDRRVHVIVGQDRRPDQHHNDQDGQSGQEQPLEAALAGGRPDCRSGGGHGSFQAEEDIGAQGHLAARPQRHRAADALAVDKGAVARTKVLQNPIAPSAGQAGVVAGHLGVINDDVVVHRPADGQNVFV